MADKIKKTPPKVANKKEASVAMSLDDLNKSIQTKLSELLEAKRGHRAGELTNPRVISSTRKEIARLKTAVRAGELKGEK
jgi:ribosomal protein L29